MLCLCWTSGARAEARLFLGEPYGYDGKFAGTGHAAVYLSGVCAETPVQLRPCAPGENGVVLSRYRGIGGYDWIAIPLIPYLYAVEKPQDIPLYADRKLVAFLRDQYRRDHLQAVVPDLPDGGTPAGDWYELIGASYLRTIYSFQIDTTPEQDARLIHALNDHSNRQRWNLVTANCADFARQVITLYYPHSVHRGIIGDLGVTTPKQLGRTLSKYVRRHPELQSSAFVIPQVPGTIPRSKRMKGVFEVMLTAKKYMLPIFLFHPYAAGTAVAVYVEHWHFNPGKDAPILDAKNQRSPRLTRSEQRAIQDQLEELIRESSPETKARDWASLQAAAEPALDDSGAPTLKIRIDEDITPVGAARSNILTVSGEKDLAAKLLEARLREELKPAAAPKTARSDVENDLQLLEQLLREQSARVANNSGLATEGKNSDVTPVR